MTFNTKIRLLQAFNHIPAIAGAYLFVLNPHWWPVLLISFVILAPISTTVTLHRLLAHKSFTTWPWLEKVLSFLSIYATLGSTIGWVAVHRYHHVTSDTEKDPHSPHNGIWGAWTGYGWKLENIPPKFIKDLLRQKHHKWIHKYYFKVIIATVIVMALIHPLLPLFAYFLPQTLMFHGTNAVNFLGHWHGYRNYDIADKSTNSWIANIFGFGDGWHNNHHANPSRYYHGERWWEWDPMGVFIRLIRTNKEN